MMGFILYCRMLENLNMFIFGDVLLRIVSHVRYLRTNNYNTADLK